MASTDAVDVELTLPAGAYTVQAKASHWLRGAALTKVIGAGHSTANMWQRQGMNRRQGCIWWTSQPDEHGVWQRNQTATSGP
ncbi:MAG: hypothetical protein RMM08_02055 [Armatimonadota bacterium]|nr:hypothetical protein [Armatimonadota bacterium]